MKSIFKFLFVANALMACTSKSNYEKAADEIVANSPKPVNMNVGKQNYTLDIPKGWTSEHRNVYGVNYYILSAPKTEDDPNTNIILATEDMKNLSLGDYKNGSIASVQKSIPSASILEQGEITANGLKGDWYSYTMEPQGEKVTLVSYIFRKMV